MKAEATTEFDGATRAEVKGQPASVTPWRRLAWSSWLMKLAWRGHPPRFIGLAVGFALAALGVRAGMAAWQAGGDAAARDDTRPAQLVAFLRDDLPADRRRALADALLGLPGIASVRSLGGAEVLARMRTELGARAAVLDGVEEGFLPATLEISLRPGAERGGRADTLAWRLRRMDGVADVDLLRSSADEAVVAARRQSDALRILGMTGAGLLVLGALFGSWLSVRSLRSEAVLLARLGFGAGALALPVALLGASAALLGSAVGTGLWATAMRIGGGLVWHATAVPLWRDLLAGRPGEPVVPAVAVVVGLGGCLGWWGARPSERQLEALGPE